MSDTETVSLNLEGNFAAEAAASAIAAAQLAAALDKAGEERASIEAPQVAGYKAVTAELQQMATVQAKIASFDAKRTRELHEQEKLLKQMKDDATGVTEENNAKKQEEAADKSSKSDMMMMAGAAGALAGVAAKVIQAEIDFAKQVLAITMAGQKFAIEQTSKREVQGSVLGKLGGDYEQTVHMALKMGIDPDQAVAETKKLLNAKFSNTEIPALIRIKTGLDLSQGEGKGDELLGKLEKIKLEPKVKLKDIESLAGLGIETKDVYAKLAKEMGTDVPTAMSKVKAGAADSAQVIKAIEATAGKQFGGLADVVADSVPALAAQVKGDLSEMFAFDPALLTPIKEVLHNVLSVIEGPDGKAMKGALSELFDEINHAVLDNFRGEEGKKKIQDFAKAVVHGLHEFKDAIHEAAPAIKLLENIALASGKDVGNGGPLRTLLMTLTGLGALSVVIDDLSQLQSVLEDLDSISMDGISDAIDGFEMEAIASLSNLLTDAEKAGDDLVNGIADGITGGASKAIEAAENMARDALDAAKRVLGIASPSTEFASVGGYSAEGMAQGMSGHPGPAAAGAGMAKSALDAASGTAGGAGAAGASVGGQGGAGGPGGAAGSTYHLTVQMSAKSTAEGKQGVEAMLPQLEAMLRRIDRDKREGANP